MANYDYISRIHGHIETVPKSIHSYIQQLQWRNCETIVDMNFSNCLTTKLFSKLFLLLFDRNSVLKYHLFHWELRTHLVRDIKIIITSQMRFYASKVRKLCTRPPLPIKTYTTFVPTFAKKRYFFKRRREFAKSRKMVFFSGMNRRNVVNG